MKNIIYLLFFAALCFVFYSCSNSPSPSQKGSTSPSRDMVEDEPDDIEGFVGNGDGDAMPPPSPAPAVDPIPEPTTSDPSMVNFLNAKFPFPPPECNTSYEISNSIFSEMKTLGEVSSKITNALSRKSYPYQFMSVPNGFAIVTQMEQYNKDGSVIDESTGRWADTPKAGSFGFSMSYFKSLMFPNKCHLRVYVFIVTSQNFSSDEETVVSKVQAAHWFSEGINRLPSQIASKPFNDLYGISFLVYEFEVPESNHEPKQLCPSKYQASEHLERSGLMEYLR